MLFGSLDGGMRRWLALGLPLDEVVPCPPARLRRAVCARSAPRRTTVLLAAGDATAPRDRRAGGPSAIGARSSDRRGRGVHVPGARNHPFTRASSAGRASCRPRELRRQLTVSLDGRGRPTGRDCDVRVGRHRLPPAARARHAGLYGARASTRAPGASGRATRPGRCAPGRIGLSGGCRKRTFPGGFCYRSPPLFCPPARSRRECRTPARNRPQAALKNRGLARPVWRDAWAMAYFASTPRATSSCARTKRPTTRSTCTR